MSTQPDDMTIVKRIARFIAKNGLKYERRMIKNVKSPRVNFLRNPEDPLHGLYKQKLAEYLSQIQEHGAIVDDDVDVAADTSTQEVTEPPPGNIRDDIESVAHYISKKGFLVERLMRQSEGARYSFMRRSDLFHAFYLKKLTEYPSQNQQEGASANELTEFFSRIQKDGPTDYKRKLTEFLARYKKDLPNQDDDAVATDSHDAQPDRVRPQPIVLPYGLDCILPKGVTGKEFKTMKLTAQFGAWYGNDFWLGFKDRVGFEFTNPTDGRFPRFTRLVLEYSEVFKPPKGLKDKASKSDAYMAAIRDGFFCLLQWDSLQERKWFNGGVMSMVNWHASLDKDFPDDKDSDEELPPPSPGTGMSLSEPEPKRQKFDEPGLVPEDQFLAQHPGWSTIRVSCVDVNGREFDIIEKTVQSLSETVASFKEKLAEGRGVPIQPEKQLLFGKAGLLDNNKSLAHYNVGAGEILTLSLCMCGRETDVNKACCCNERSDKAIGEMMRDFNSWFY